jgi:hypothetical protein
MMHILSLIESFIFIYVEIMQRIQRHFMLSLRIDWVKWWESNDDDDDDDDNDNSYDDDDDDNNKVFYCWKSCNYIICIYTFS